MPLGVWSPGHSQPPLGCVRGSRPTVPHLKGCLTPQAMRLRAILSVPQGPGDTGSGVCVQSRGFGKAPRLKPGPCHVVPGVPKPLDSAVRAGTSSEALPPAQRYVSRQLCVTAASPARCLCHRARNPLVTGVAWPSLRLPGRSACTGSRCDTRAGRREPRLSLHFPAGPIRAFLA